MAESESSNEDTHMIPYTRCRNWSAGCTSVARLDMMSSHEATCGYRQVRCLHKGCGWVHRLNELAARLAQHHNVSVIEVQEDRAELVLQDPNNKENSMRMVLLLHHESVFVVTYERTGPFYTEAKLDVVTLTPRCDEYEFEIIIRGPSGVNSWRSQALPCGTSEDTSVRLSESFINNLAPDGMLRMQIKLTKSVM
ncbi:uncharacterized protein LOC142575822 isoform X1 [Dermacentor variabilis]|uniref:uncharacterized protein LOC142575822 isoform X1 n=1 Tax=Dermacentor variabilis TaxID=34621 RepID=UPI003F5C8EEB